MEAIHEMHAKSNFLSDFILGSQDGLVNVLGIILGVTAASVSIQIVFIASLAALVAESISMGAVAYTSTSARRKQYLKEVEREKFEMRTMPQMERAEVKEIFREWGYKGSKLEKVTDDITSNPKAWLEFMMAHELKLAPVAKGQPLRSGVLVGLASVVGSAIPLVPFIFTSNIPTGVMWSIAVSGVALFLIGVYEAKTTVGSLWASGIRMAIIGLVAGIGGYLVGRLLGA